MPRSDLVIPHLKSRPTEPTRTVADYGSIGPARRAGGRYIATVRSPARIYPEYGGGVSLVRT